MKRKNWIALLLVCLMMLGTLTTALAEEPFAISIMTLTFATEPPTAESRVQKMIEEYTNTKLNITWKPSAGYDENLNILVASNDMPMLTLVRDNKMPVIVQAVESDVFWDVTDYLDQFPNLSQMNEQVKRNTSYNGRTIGMYRAVDFARSGWIYRKDWADKLGLSAPTTLEELYAMIDAFTTQDPDGNGKNDTFGLIMAADIAVKLEFHSMVVAQGGGNEWVEDGKGGVIPTFMTEPYIKALDFFRRLYAEKAMNQDYPSASKNNIYEYWTSQQGGVFYMSMFDSIGATVSDNLLKINPDAEIDVFSRVAREDGGVNVYPTKGWNGMFFISKKAVPTEEALLKVLDFLDKLNDDAMRELVLYGIEGEHFVQNADGLIDQIDREGFNAECADFGQLNPAYRMWPERKLNYLPLQGKIYGMIDENAEIAVTNIIEPFISETYTMVGGTLDQLIYDARDKYIIGAIDLNGFNAEVQRWLNQGGQAVIDEYSQQYAAAQAQ